MKNKIGYGKTLTISIIIAIIFITTNVIINYVAYRTYTKNFNAKIDLIIGETIKENPDTDKDTLIKILNNEDTKSDDILKKYGIKIKKATIPKKKKSFNIECFNLDEFRKKKIQEQDDKKVDLV